MILLVKRNLFVFSMILFLQLHSMNDDEQKLIVQHTNDFNTLLNCRLVNTGMKKASDEKFSKIITKITREIPINYRELNYTNGAYCAFPAQLFSYILPELKLNDMCKNHLYELLPHQQQESVDPKEIKAIEDKCFNDTCLKLNEVLVEKLENLGLNLEINRYKHTVKEESKYIVSYCYNQNNKEHQKKPKQYIHIDAFFPVNEFRKTMNNFSKSRIQISVNRDDIVDIDALLEWIKQIITCSQDYDNIELIHLDKLRFFSEGYSTEAINNIIKLWNNVLPLEISCNYVCLPCHTEYIKYLLENNVLYLPLNIKKIIDERRNTFLESLCFNKANDITNKNNYEKLIKLIEANYNKTDLERENKFNIFSSKTQNTLAKFIELNDRKKGSDKLLGCIELYNFFTRNVLTKKELYEYCHFDQNTYQKTYKRACSAHPVVYDFPLFFSKLEESPKWHGDDYIFKSPDIKLEKSQKEKIKNNMKFKRFVSELIDKNKRPATIVKYILRMFEHETKYPGALSKEVLTEYVHYLFQHNVIIKELAQTESGDISLESIDSSLLYYSSLLKYIPQIMKKCEISKESEEDQKIRKMYYYKPTYPF